MKLLPFVIIWAVLATGVLCLALYRRFIATKEDDTLHVSSDAGSSVATQQTEIAKKLEAIDHWGKLLTIIVAALGVLLLAWFLYMGWQQGGRLSGE